MEFDEKRGLGSLPREAISDIFSFLDAKSVASLIAVNRLFSNPSDRVFVQLVESHQLWRVLTSRGFNPASSSVQPRVLFCLLSRFAVLQLRRDESKEVDIDSDCFVPVQTLMDFLVFLDQHSGLAGHLAFKQCLLFYAEQGSSNSLKFKDSQIGLVSAPRQNLAFIWSHHDQIRAWAEQNVPSLPRWPVNQQAIRCIVQPFADLTFAYLLNSGVEPFYYRLRQAPTSILRGQEWVTLLDGLELHDNIHRFWLFDFAMRSTSCPPYIRRFLDLVHHQRKMAKKTR
eukprot:TRINITY_DN9085_c0_g1_i3.p1 TRINITY_DN9085_c0_g1~~TRINITY_DN9085_c0_g1_i3.p1  ORF type:complete len:284 (-),score=16.04 TRINITY_DN9085_c0_g1_i3:42-893(-)